MFGETSVTADVTNAAPASFAAGAFSLNAFAPFPLGTVARHAFAIEESEMLTEVSFEGTVAGANADQPVAFTFFVDGVDKADLADGLVLKSMSHIAGQGDVLTLVWKGRLAKGQHTAELRCKSAAAVTILGALRPAKLRVTRWSSNAVNAPAQNSKQVSGSY